MRWLDPDSTRLEVIWWEQTWREQTWLEHVEKTQSLFKPAEQGDTNAQFELARRFHWGCGISRNTTEALKWYLKAGHQGQPEAQSVLGRVYSGPDYYLPCLGLMEDLEKSREWYQRALDQDDIAALKHFGFGHKNGNWGFTKDLEAAYGYFLRAADLGDADAQFWVAEMTYDAAIRSGFTSRKADEMAMWYRKAAEQGNEEAQLKLGIFHIGFSQSLPKFQLGLGLKWLQASAEQGFIVAEAFVIECHEGGHGFCVNFKKAIRWIELAAKRGEVGAQLKLAEYYRLGKGVERDSAKAALWIQKSKISDAWNTPPASKHMRRNYSQLALL
jgi:TPR repeat protein